MGCASKYFWVTSLSGQSVLLSANDRMVKFTILCKYKGAVMKKKKAEINMQNRYIFNIHRCVLCPFTKAKKNISI